jgi:hypothetical protein
LAQAVIAMPMITSPPYPVKILPFNTTIERQHVGRHPRRRCLPVARQHHRPPLTARNPLLSRIGGLLLATNGAQMMLGGLKSFFAA